MRGATHNLTINTDFLSNGIYYYKIQNSNEKIKIGYSHQKLN